MDFWSNHLNVANPSDNVWWSRHDYDRTVIRRHALGKFSDMLTASATHPAMMTYLNNAESTKDNPNENYGRELLELHTVGVDGGYTEDEMRTSALILTGLGVHWYDDVNDGTFNYNPDNHYTGHVKVLSWSSPNASAGNGLKVALDYVDYLAHTKSTARRIAYKLCERFLSDKPPAGLVDKMADTYRAHDTAIVPVLHELFGSKAFRQLEGREGHPADAGRRGHAADPRRQARRATARTGSSNLYWTAREPERRAARLGAAQRLPGLRRRLALGRRHPEPLEHAHLALAAGWWPATSGSPTSGEPPADEAPQDTTATSSRRSRSDWCSARSPRRTATPSSRSSGKSAGDPLQPTPRRVDVAARRTWWRSSSTRPITGSGDQHVHDEAPPHARPAAAPKPCGCPHMPRDLPAQLPEGRGRRRHRGRASPARTCSRGWRSAPRRTRATCWSCCRSAAASTA